MGVAEDQPRRGDAREQLVAPRPTGSGRNERTSDSGEAWQISVSSRATRGGQRGEVGDELRRRAPRGAAAIAPRHDRVLGRVVRARRPALAVAADPERGELAQRARPSPPASRRTARSRRRARTGRRRRRRRGRPRAPGGCRARHRPAPPCGVYSIGAVTSAGSLASARLPHETDPLVVSGPRLSLRYATPDDAPRLFELAADPAVTRFFSWGPYTTIEQPEAYIAALPAQARGGRAARLPDRRPRRRADRRHRAVRAGARATGARPSARGSGTAGGARARTSRPRR